MNYWHQIPIVRLLIPFIAGILLALYMEKSLEMVYFLFSFLVVVYVVFVAFYSRKLGFKYRWLVGVLQSIILLLAGYGLGTLNTPRFQIDNISHFPDTELVMARVIEPVSEKEKSYKIVTKVMAVKDSSAWAQATGTLLYYFQKDSLCTSIKYGDELIVNARLNEIKVAQNPGEFNYKRYLENKGIYKQAYVQSGNWEIIGHGKGNIIIAGGIHIREKLLKILNQNGLVGSEYAVVSAILLGYDNYLDADQKQQFAAAGAMHILCVSGLHVGIIYFVINIMLSFLKRKRILRLLKLAIILSVIWLYASITGFSPSVLRASTMFTCIAIGMSMKQRINIFNMLAVSAFILLAYNPFIITEVGFQLSYLAVTGILLLYKPIYNLFISKYWIVDKVWQISVVSIAATIATFPLSIYYFHQFPRLFLLTNLVAIPSAMIIIYLGILVLLLSPFQIISIVVGKVLSYVIWFLNFSVSWIEGLPYSAASGLFITRIELLLIYGVIASLIALVIVKRKFYIWISMLFVIFIVSSFFIRQYNTHTYSGVTLYSIRNSSAIDFIHNGDVVFLADSIVLSNPQKFRYQIDNNRTQAGVKEITDFQYKDPTISKDWFRKTGSFIFFDDRTYVMVDKDFQVFQSLEKFQSDFIIYSQNAHIPVADLCQSFEIGLFIIDSSNSKWKIEQLKEECISLGVDYYCVEDSGAWVYSN